MASPRSQPQSSRRRSSSGSKECSTEDQALNTIAKEAEARLAAKRAARAEARSIRMKELEQKQKEAADNDEIFLDSEFVDEDKYSTRNVSMKEYTTSCIGSTITTYDTPNSALVSINISNDYQISQLKETVREGEEKYKNAMVNAAQLDNERQALQYYVEILKDMNEELKEKIDNTDNELLHKCMEYNRLTREHNQTSSELKKCILIVEERERALGENGINLDGTIKDGYTLPVSATQCNICSETLNNDIDSVDGDRRGRGSLLAEIASLKTEMEDLKQTSNPEHFRRELESMKRNMQQQIVELKTQIQVLEQKNAQKEGLVVRLETQVKRYKQQADAAESVEDNLLADKRKISRELRQCQEQVIELENEKEQLKKRLEKLKSRRGIDL